MSDVLRVGILGFGFMGRTHARAYQHAQADGYACELVSVADHSIRSFDEADLAAGNLETGVDVLALSDVQLFSDAHELIKSSDVDLLSICTHTDTHVQFAIDALNAGKHVLVEKPVAIRPSDVQRLADAAAMSDRVCMPAMCMRYWPAWVRIHEMIRSKQYGHVRSAEFHRMGSRPKWAAEFYADEARSGGALYDLHIHDTDFIVHCFGLPKSVTTSGDGLHLSTIYHYERGSGSPMHVLAQGAWDHQPSVGFRMRCTIVCERATIDFDIARDNQLIVHRGEESETIDVGSLSGYDGEIRAFVDHVRGSRKNATSMDDAALVARLLECERRSMLSHTTEMLE